MLALAIYDFQFSLDMDSLNSPGHQTFGLQLDLC